MALTTSPTTDARTALWSPTAAAVIGADLYVADAWNHVVWRFPPHGPPQRIVGTGRSGDGADGAAPRDVALCAPSGVTVAPDGTLYVADTGNDAVRRIAGGTASTVGRFRRPRSVAITAEGEVLVLAGDTIHRIGRRGRGASLPLPSLSQPSGLASAPDGILVADAQMERVFRLDVGGAVTPVAGATLRAVTGPADGDGGPAVRARLRRPTGLATDPDGGILVVESDGRRLRRIHPDGTIATVLELPGHAVLASAPGGSVLVGRDQVRWLDRLGRTITHRPITAPAVR